MAQKGQRAFFSLVQFVLCLTRRETALESVNNNAEATGCCNVEDE
jgi:hypothetical protein